MTQTSNATQKRDYLRDWLPEPFRLRHVVLAAAVLAAIGVLIGLLAGWHAAVLERYEQVGLVILLAVWLVPVITAAIESLVTRRIACGALDRISAPVAASYGAVPLVFWLTRHQHDLGVHAVLVRHHLNGPASLIVVGLVGCALGMIGVRAIVGLSDIWADIRRGNGCEYCRVGEREQSLELIRQARERGASEKRGAQPAASFVRARVAAYIRSQIAAPRGSGVSEPLRLPPDIGYEPLRVPQFSFPDPDSNNTED